MKCPVCFSRLTDKPPEYSDIPPRETLKYPDEKIWWCEKCADYFTEEDFLYSTEE